MRLEVILLSDLNQIPKNNRLKISKDNSEFRVYFIECLVKSIFLGKKEQNIKLDIGKHVLIADEKDQVSKISADQFEKDFLQKSLSSYPFMSTKATNILDELSKKNKISQKEANKKGIEKQ